MVALTRQFPESDGLLRRALNQAARELLLAQSSDWPFIMKAGTMVDYARKRFEDHIRRFTRLHAEITRGQIDSKWLGLVESVDNIFPDVDYRVYTPVGG
jgi:1,4-alpha-glucan branching enzyme